MVLESNQGDRNLPYAFINLESNQNNPFPRNRVWTSPQSTEPCFYLDNRFRLLCFKEKRTPDKL